jgi:hypothetical protein
MVDFPEPETPITTIAAGSGRAAPFVVPAGIDINSSVRMRRPVDPMRAPYRAAPVAIVWASAYAGRSSELVGVVNGWEPTISRPGRAIAIRLAQGTLS